MQRKLIVIIFISLFSFVFSANGQKLINSPYSRFNIGSLEPAGSFRNLGMGGVGTAIRDNNSISYSNPASYSSLDTNSFVFDFAIDYGKSIFSDGVSEYSSDDFNFHHLIFGFPLAKDWGLALGITPYSSGYYKMSEVVLSDDPEFNPTVGEYTSYHSGEGGYSNFFLGSGININKNISIGVNMTILFGQVKRVYQVNFSDIYNVYHNNALENLRLGGINFDYGIQYITPLKNDYFFNAGASLSSSKYYRSQYDQISLKATVYSSQDTISFVADDSTRAFIPGTLKLGISFGKKNKFTTGLDLIITNWSNSKIPGMDGYAADTKALLFGAELIPDRFSNYSPLKRLEYRIGGHIADNYLIIQEEQVKEIGVSFGIGLPLRRSLSKANLYFDYTRKTGPSLSKLYSSNCFTMGVSLNLYDGFWFMQRKYN
jgi:hypothetical protein